MPGLILAAPSSGSGKTTVTLGLLRALRNLGHAVHCAKSGPDYIDPRFHEAACGRPCFNLDAWAMPPETIKSLAATSDTLIIEGAMGLFDGAAPEGIGATADLARILGLPVVLIVDAARMSQSIAPLVAGFSHFDASVQIAGVILNRVGSLRHERMLRQALRPLNIPILGAIPRSAKLALPDRHLGLVQAAEHPDLEQFLEDAAALVIDHLDTNQIVALSAPLPDCQSAALRPAIGEKLTRIAVAQDQAFAFLYPHLVAAWQSQNTEVIPFSPLADETVPEADLIYIPGGYPELHAQSISAASNFIRSLKNAAQNTDIYGECGGYMVLGHTLTTANGSNYPMTGLLDLETSFQKRKLHLGYRKLVGRSSQVTGCFNGHEFHYASTITATGEPLFDAWDAEGNLLPQMGLTKGRVAGSFAHLIDVT